MATEDKSPTSPTNSDESPKNTIRVIKTSDSDHTLVEVKVAGESGTKVTVFGGDAPRAETKTNENANETDENGTKPEIESNDKDLKSTESDTKNDMDVVTMNGTEEQTTESAEKEKKENDADETKIPPLKPMTKDEIDEIVSKYNSQKNLDKFLEFFWSVDGFGFGVFTVHQFCYRLWHMGRRLTYEQIANMFADLDHDRDSLVSLDEFLDEMTREKRKPKTEEEYRVLFERCDKNQDGFICAADIEALLRDEDVSGLEEQTIFFLRRYSPRQDLKMDFPSFRKALRRCEY